MSTIQQRAEKMRAAFTTKTVKRNGEDRESTIWTLKDEHRGQAAQDLAREAHGGMLPDDWKYSYIVDALDALSEHDDPEEARDSMREGGIDVYNSELVRWVGSSLTRAGYVDEFRENVSSDCDFFTSLQGGQQQEREEVFGLVLAFLEGMDDDSSEEEAA